LAIERSSVYEVGETPVLLMTVNAVPSKDRSIEYPVALEPAVHDKLTFPTFVELMVAVSPLGAADGMTTDTALLYDVAPNGLTWSAYVPPGRVFGTVHVIIVPLFVLETGDEVLLTANAGALT
jgi:hypothetical protein